MHDNVLKPQAAKLFPKLGRFESFYLVGGTALALQIGHRISVDFDLFSETALPKNFLQKIKREFPDASIEVTYSSLEQLNLLVDRVQMTFLHFPYPVVEPFVKYNQVHLASVNEIAAMKAFTIGRRLAYKDYVDWYFLLDQGHVTLGSVVELSREKFGTEFNDRLFLGQLASLEEIPNQKIDYLNKSPDRDVISETLKSKIKEFI